MQRPLEDGSEFERLKEEVRALERRLACLESQRNITVPEVSPAATPRAASVAEGFAMPDVAAVTGRAVLGIAGAYLLRALAETSVAPRLAVVMAAIAYSGLWLFLAWRERAGRTAPFVYGATAALILAPLLWEATVRFGLLPNLVTAALLVGLPALSGILGVAGWPAVVASSATAIALMVQTGDLLPFVVAVLLIAAVAGFAASPGLRAVAGVAANASVLLLIWITGHPSGDAYRPVASGWVALCCCALPVILAAGPAKRRQIAIPELSFIGVALALTVYGAPPLAAAILLLVACAVCIWLAPNHRALEICALPAGLAGSFLLAPPWVTILIWCAGCVALSRIPRRIPAFHAVALLTGAAVLASQAPLAVVLLGLSAALAWWFSGEFVWPRVLFGSIAVATPGILLSEISGAGLKMLPTLQTLYLCAASLAISFSARRNARQELPWIGYGLLAVAALKLLMVDFRESPPAMLAVALVSFGAALIVVPRLRSAAGADESGKS